MTTKFTFLIAFSLFYLFANVSQAEQLPIASFSDSSLEGWEEKSFSGTTSYQLVSLEGKTVLRAESDDSASILIKKISVNLKKFPFLNWRWRIENRLPPADETTKLGDDYAARIYVVVDGGILPWRTRSVNYVWANEASKDSVWQNAFTGKNAMMIALRDRQDSRSTWYSEKRDVYQDLKRQFGREFESIDAIAIMTDTDNSHGQVKGYYGDIYFSSK